MDKKKSLIEIKEFIDRVNNDFKIDKVIFFGSRAYGNPKKDSDIDLILVSDDFKGMYFFQRISKMYDYWNFDIAVDFLCYTKEEFNKLKKLVSVVSHALKKGIILNT